MSDLILQEILKNKNSCKENESFVIPLLWTKRPGQDKMARTEQNGQGRTFCGVSSQVCATGLFLESG